jgi:hypothetical protein
MAPTGDSARHAAAAAIAPLLFDGLNCGRPGEDPARLARKSSEFNIDSMMGSPFLVMQRADGRIPADDPTVHRGRVGAGPDSGSTTANVDKGI